MGNIDRRGVNAVEKVFLEMSWLFREQPISDYGIDAHVEIVNGDYPSGRLLALQIKSGDSYFRKRGENYVYYGEEKHLDYWLGHSLPVFIVIHSDTLGLTLWQKIEASLVKRGARGRWSIEIPSTQTLDVNAKRAIAEGVPTDARSFRRHLLTVNSDLMREVAKRKEAYLSVEEWINKTLNFRSTQLRYDDPEKDNADIVIDTWLPADHLGELMAHYFPFFTYEYTRSIEEHFCEVATHSLRVELNDIGRSFLALENFYEEGAAPEEIAPPDADDESMTEEEWNEFLYRRAIEKDWENDDGV